MVRGVTGGAFGGRNFLSLGVGQVVMGVSQWATISVLALLGGAADVGELALALAVVTPIYELVKLKLRDVLATDVDHRWPVSDYLLLTIVASAVGLVLSAVIAGVLGGTTAVLVVAGVAVSRGYEAVSHISYGYQQQSDAMAKIGRSLSLRGVLSIALLAVAFWLTRSVVLAAASMAVTNALIYHFYDRAEMVGADRSQPDEAEALHSGTGSLVRIRKLAISAYPLGVFSALHAMTDSVPRLIVGVQLGLADLGIFAAFGYVVTGTSYITRALSQASSSRMASLVATGTRSQLSNRIRHLVFISAVAGIAVIAGAYLFGEVFLRLAFGSEFAEFSTEFTIMSAYAFLLFVQTPLNLLLIAAREFSVQMVIQIVTTVAAVGATFLLVPIDGIRGAVFALLLAGLIRLVATGWACSRVYRRLPA